MVSSLDLDAIVSTTSGRLLGQKTLVNKNVEVFEFLGVPYAQPPVGENRFEKPKQLSMVNSSQIVIAQQFKPSCIQMKHLTKAINPLLDVDELNNISEDCLYLNIYVPNVNDDTPLPVMVWLPGEGFDFADARQFNGAYLASIGKVIVVTVQYRVGVFGFLKNNAGLYDQLAALQWINKNIAGFNGNPDDVTLFGRFTGSMSISILLSSPEVINSPINLFNRAILMSGIAVGNWVFDKRHDDKIRRILQNYCADIECLKTVPAMDILEKGGLGWKPFIDMELIVEEPLNALRKGKFSKSIDSIMLGSNQFEGSLCLLKHLAIDEPFYGRLIRNNVTIDEYERIIREDLEMFYDGDNQIDDYKTGIISTRDSYLQFCSELLIDSHMREYEALLSKIYFNKNYNLQKIYKYKVDYKPTFSIAPDFINSSIHGDDVLLAFGLAFKPSKTNDNTDDQEMSKRMVQLFSNFAQDGTLRSFSDRFINIKMESKSYEHTNQAMCQWKLQQGTILIAIASAIVLIFFLLTIFIIRLIFLVIGKQSSCEQIKSLIRNC